ncbi:MAG: flavin reductase family protein [Ruminococcus sp.]|nr:flavin reductase family protein [Ruminococcus sp.]
MNLEKFNLAPLYVLDKEWALLTVGNKEKFNAMTISWGGLGTLWHKPVVTIYLRPNRYTYELMKNHECFTISFYDEDYKKDLTTLGTKSGRDTDKIALTKLTPEFLKQGTTFKQAKLTIICKKLYYQDLDINNIPTDEINKFYKTEPIHKMFIGEVIDIIDKRM